MIQATRSSATTLGTDDIAASKPSQALIYPAEQGPRYETAV